MPFPPISIVLIVLPLSSDGYKITDIGGGPLLIKPYPYQLLENTNDLLNERDGGASNRDTLAAVPVWRAYTKDKYQLGYPLASAGPLSLAMPVNGGGSDIWQTDDRELGQHRQQEGYPMTSSEIDFETLNDFDDINLIRNAIWLPASAKYPNERNNKQPTPLQRQRLTLQPLAETTANIRYGKNINLPIFMATKRHESTTSLLEQLRKEEDGGKEDGNNDNGNNDDKTNDPNVIDNHKNVRNADDNGSDDGDDVNDASEAKDDDFSAKDKDSKSKKSNSNTSPSNSGEANERQHYSVKKEIVRNNYHDHNKENELEYVDSHGSEKRSKDAFRDKKKPKSLASTPFLPAVSGGKL